MSTATSAGTAVRRPQAASHSLGALVVHVAAYEDAGSWWAETPDYPGLTVVAPTRDELVTRIKPAVEFHLEECGIEFDPEGLHIYVTFGQLGLTA